MKTGFRNRLLLTLLLVLTVVSSTAMLPGFVHARECSGTKLPCSLATDCVPAGQTCDATSSDYCINPAFITAGVKPNLLLMIDNSASMYDLVYTDATVKKYCANNPSTSCATVGNACSGSATCYASADTSTTTSTSSIACTIDSQCSPVSAGGTGICPLGSTCVWDAGDTCNAGRGQCKKSVATLTVTTSIPVACSADSDCSAVTPGDTCNNKCTAATTPCLDSSYSNTGNYSGYFTQTANYCYSSKVTSVSGAPGWTDCSYSGFYNEFDPVYVAMPASCNYGGSSSATPYLCVNIDAGTGLVNKFVASGRFLNWLSTSKFDVQKSILTGGKVSSTLGGDLIGESRGCSGRNFIKTIPGLGLTFGIRGGESSINNTSQATQYGNTHIEIYKGTYNTSDCTAAMNDWQNVTSTNLGPLQVDTKNCVGGTGSISDELAAANQSIHDCFWYYNGHGLTNLQPIKNTCEKVWATTAASTITAPDAPAAICSNALSHAASINDGGAGNTTGYLGSCYTGGVWDNTCALIENKDYCQSLGGTGAVSDPPSDAIVSETVQNVPGFMMSLGVANMPMINDYSAYVNGRKGFLVAVFQAPPQGLIQKYKDKIRFGAMTFQNNGSATECNSSGVCSATSTNSGSVCTSDANCTGGGKCIFSIPCTKTCSNALERQCYVPDDCKNIKNPMTGAVTSGTCGALAKTDGSKIVSYVGSGKCSITTTQACDVDSECPGGQYCVADVGDQYSGLIKAINDIPATSWTPFAEAFYNAIGYYARTNAYAVGTPTSRSDADFSQFSSPNTAASYNANKNPSQFKCQANNLLLITDGMSTADKSTAPDALAALYAASVPNIVSGTTTYGISGYDTTHSCPAYLGSRSVSNLAWIARNRNIKTLVTSGTASTEKPLNSSEAITSYVVYSGPQTSGKPGLCDPLTLMTNTATNGGTSLFSAENPDELRNEIDSAFSSVAAKAASGTAASILSNSEGSGANILQAVFYPKKIFDSGTDADWIGEMLNLWYFVDPYINNSTIREDSDLDNTLNLINDRVARFTFDNSADRTMVQLYSDDNGDGLGDTAINGLIDPDDVKTLWRAGRLLWQRDLSVAPRTIYTPLLTGGTEVAGTGLMKFSWVSPDNSAFLQTPMQFPGNNAATVKMMKWVHGFDFPAEKATIRNRTVKYGSIPAANVSSVSTDLYVSNPRDKGIGVWKLGDIISSTPRVQSTIRQNTYDLPRPGGYLDKSYASYVTSKDYGKRGMVYVGANDGMLHAFHLGILSVKAAGFQKASLSDPDSIGYGKEMWAYIPNNFLPYLKYQAEPAARHLYAVDGRTTILDASIGDVAGCTKAEYWLCDKGSTVVDASGNLDSTKNTWRSVVIGGMGLGGASRSSCSGDVACVQTPSGTLGYSSYFALDVTNPVNPKLLWEFSHNSLGYATTGPAIIRVGADRNKNGRWLAVFGNGPFGNIDTNANQFQGNSDHHLRFFFVDLRTGELIKPTSTSTDDTIMTDIDNGFAGSMLGAAIDADRWEATTANYQDDAIYVGYTKAVTSAGVTKWTGGGVGRIMIEPLPAGTEPTNANLLDRFKWSKVLDNIGPVTTGISRLQDRKNKNLWLFFGTGRYYFRDTGGLDDPDSVRALFGIKEPCYTTGNHIDTACNSAISESLVNQTSSIGVIAADDPGWKIDLDASTTAGVDGATASEGAERVVTDTVALTNGTVFFTSFKPTMDICGYGGNSYLWGVKYDTGGQAASNALQGKALIQLSTGEFKEVDLAQAFTDTGTLNRRMATPMTGKPPSDAPPIISNSQNRPVKKILHIQER